MRYLACVYFKTIVRCSSSTQNQVAIASDLIHLIDPTASFSLPSRATVGSRTRRQKSHVSLEITN
jgi:hypothetical protein